MEDFGLLIPRQGHAANLLFLALFLFHGQELLGAPVSFLHHLVVYMFTTSSFQFRNFTENRTITDARVQAWQTNVSTAVEK